MRKFKRNSAALMIGLAALLLTAMPREASAGKLEIQAGSGISAYLLGHGIVFNGAILYRPTGSQIKFGLESGIWLLRIDPSLIGLPFLATWAYHIPVSGSASPYIGGSLGFMVNLDNIPTRTGLAIYGKSGVVFPVEKGVDVDVQMKVGGVDASLNVIGQANLVIGL